MLGNYLKEKRLQRDVSLKDISKATRIRLEYLKALEENEFQKIPGEVYIKGYIVEYLRYLREDPEEALKLYNATKVKPENGQKSEASKPKRFSLKYAFVPLVIALLIVPAYLFLKPTDRGVVRKPQLFTKGVRKERGSEIIDILKPSVNSAEADYKNRHILKVEATEESWVLIKIDDDITYSMVLRPGEVKSWSAEKGFYLKTGNAGGIKVSFDDRMLGSPGKRGAVVSMKLPEDLKKFFRD